MQKPTVVVISIVAVIVGLLAIGITFFALSVMRKKRRHSRSAFKKSSSGRRAKNSGIFDETASTSRSSKPLRSNSIRTSRNSGHNKNNMNVNHFTDVLANEGTQNEQEKEIVHVCLQEEILNSSHKEEENWLTVESTLPDSTDSKHSPTSTAEETYNFYDANAVSSCKESLPILLSEAFLSQEKNESQSDGECSTYTVSSFFSELQLSVANSVATMGVPQSQAMCSEIDPDEY